MAYRKYTITQTLELVRSVTVLAESAEEAFDMVDRTKHYIMNSNPGRVQYHEDSVIAYGTKEIEGPL